MAVSVFCGPCDLEAPNLAISVISLFFLHLRITNVEILWRRPIRPVKLHCTGMKTSLSCDYVASGFLIIVTPYINKSYKKLVIVQ